MFFSIPIVSIVMCEKAAKCWHKCIGNRFYCQYVLSYCQYVLPYCLNIRTVAWRPLCFGGNKCATAQSTNREQSLNGANVSQKLRAPNWRCFQPSMMEHASHCWAIKEPFIERWRLPIDWRLFDFLLTMSVDVDLYVVRLSFNSRSYLLVLSLYARSIVDVFSPGTGRASERKNAHTRSRFWLIID